MDSDRPHIKTTYKPDGTMTQEPKGFGGGLCHSATEPYLARQGQPVKKKATAEAGDEPYLLKERERNRENA